MDKLNINAIDASQAPKDDNIDYILGFTSDGELKATTITAQSSDTYDRATIDAKDLELRQHTDLAISNLIGGATPEALDTLSELAAALEKEGDAIVAINAELATKYSPSNKPTPSDIGVYTKAEVDAKDDQKLNLTGGIITGIIKKDTTHGSFLSGGNGFGDLLGINDSGGAGGAYLGKDGYWLRTGNESNQPKVIRGGNEYEIYHQGNKPTPDELGAFNANYKRGTPAAAYYGTTGQGTEGTKIRLPWVFYQGQMVSFTVRVYQNYQSYDVQFSGYLYETPNNWYTPRAILMASSAPSMSVRMGRDDDGRAYVWLEGGHYRGVGVFDVIVGYQEGDANKGWEISESNHVPNLAYDEIIYPPFSKTNKPSAADVGAFPTTGGLLSGPVSATSLGVNQTDGVTGEGISLYAGSVSGMPNYGMFFGTTSSWGGFGQVDSDWATYLTMTGSDRRGWIFKHNGNNVASINSQGHGTFNEVLTNGKVTINGNSGSFMALDATNHGSGWSYLQLSSGGTVAHIAHNNTAIEGADANSLHLRPNGVNLGSLALQPNAQMLHQTGNGWVKIGSLNGDWVHFNTDRPKYHFDKPLGVQGEIYCGGDYRQRVYHEGFKPTAAEINAFTIHPWINAPALDADTLHNGSGFTYSNNAPYSGTIASFGNQNFGYALQLSSAYGGNLLAFRTHNGDIGQWNSWRELAALDNGILTVGSISLSGQDISVYGKRALVGSGAENRLILNYAGDFGAGTSVNGYLAADSFYSPAITGAEIYSDGWFRARGNNGIYFENWGGGFHMTDSTWIRTYGNRKFFVENSEFDAINTAGGIKAVGNLDINAISARGRITTSAGFSGDGSGLTNLQYSAIRGQWTNFHYTGNGTRGASRVTLPAGVLNHLAAGGTVSIKVHLVRNGNAGTTSDRTTRLFTIDGSEGWNVAGCAYDSGWNSRAYLNIYNNHSAYNEVDRNKVVCQYEMITRCDYRLD